MDIFPSMEPGYEKYRYIFDPMVSRHWKYGHIFRFRKLGHEKYMDIFCPLATGHLKNAFEYRVAVAVL